LVLPLLGLLLGLLRELYLPEQQLRHLRLPLSVCLLEILSLMQNPILLHRRLLRQRLWLLSQLLCQCLLQLC
jgi:hypothetical protein